MAPGRSEEGSFVKRLVIDGKEATLQYNLPMPSDEKRKQSADVLPIDTSGGAEGIRTPDPVQSCFRLLSGHENGLGGLTDARALLWCPCNSHLGPGQSAGKPRIAPSVSPGCHLMKSHSTIACGRRRREAGTG